MNVVVDVDHWSWVRFPQTAPLILPTRNATASGVVPFEPPIEADGGCVSVYTPTLKSVLVE
ncbi:hypothetical protein A2U01_0094966 [Trifolium medium]|uniref:Uncharacterized protein n=1 Tax=Trifolium medium TaxID=97028 RepID=A0A392UJS0_9FABA|nr:hypothetical protein [Trifolium medium]